MKRKHLGTQFFFGITILCSGVLAAPAVAEVSVQIGIPLPPPIVFAAPPQVVVLPGFDIYVAPDIAEEVYFVDGFWWRPWQGHWYRSHSYDNGWSSYSGVPTFYGNVRQNWRSDYRNRRWEGQAWNYERMPHQRVEQNWSSWKSSNYWESQQNWGVPGMKGAQQAHGQRPSSSEHRAATRQHGKGKPQKQHLQKATGKPKSGGNKGHSRHGGGKDKH